MIHVTQKLTPTHARLDTHLECAPKPYFIPQPPLKRAAPKSKMQFMCPPRTAGLSAPKMKVYFTQTSRRVSYESSCELPFVSTTPGYFIKETQANLVVNSASLLFNLFCRNPYTMSCILYKKSSHMYQIVDLQQQASAACNLLCAYSLQTVPH